ncbi:hypothetical protein OB919_15150 [Halobacteria archaeon AArc-curdl1]|uniref:Uncharacterized protein n=1 Tax=Natronosalvus hydrolyticus TaxID=2979988 RepID=A0AAP3E6Z6_9EURY|nr:hypothetical protein [Halobacteria archaeon AArc-curdl1]
MTVPRLARGSYELPSGDRSSDRRRRGQRRSTKTRQHARETGSPSSAAGNLEGTVAENVEGKR